MYASAIIHISFFIIKLVPTYLKIIRKILNIE